MGLLPPESNSTYDDNFLQPEPQKYLNCGGPLISQRMEHPFGLLVLFLEGLIITYLHFPWEVQTCLSAALEYTNDPENVPDQVYLVWNS